MLPHHNSLIPNHILEKERQLRDLQAEHTRMQEAHAAAISALQQNHDQDLSNLRAEYEATTQVSQRC